MEDLQATRQRYHVRLMLEDSVRPLAVPGYQRWLDGHFHSVRQLAGRAVIYETN